MTRTKMLRVSLGLGLLAAYVVVAAATTGWAPGRMRPLFDGFASHPGQYYWVNPPKEFAQGNQTPDGATAEIVFKEGTSILTSAATQDGQFQTTLVEGSLAPRPPDETAKIVVKPFDSGKLGRLPSGLRAESNAYRVEVVHLPSQTAAPVLAVSGTVGLTSAATASTLLFSADGTQWQPVDGRPLAGGAGITGPLKETGYYLAAGNGEPRAPSATPKTSSPVVLYLAAAAVPLVLGYLLLSRRGQTKKRRPASPASTRRTASQAPRTPPRRPATASKKKKRKKR